MILCLIFFYFLGGSTASNNTTNAAGDSCFSKSIMCKLKGNLKETDVKLVDLEIKDIPPECEVIIYNRFSVNKLSVINVDEAALQSVVALNKPVLLVLQRDNTYSDWAVILGPEGNAKETKILCDFALKNNVSGFLIDDLTPRCMYVPFNENVGKFIIPYIKQLKCSEDFKIGVVVQPLGSTIKNPCMYNFAEMNDLVTFYGIDTRKMNQCKPQMYNGQTPITKVDHGANYMFGMEEVAEMLKESKICLTKTTYVIELVPLDMSSESEFNTYSQACKGEMNCSASCIQTTTNFFDKGKFVLAQGSGVIVQYIDLDDIKNDCGCSSAFAGFQNIIAGLRGGSPIPCAKFDVQSTEYIFK